MTGENEDPPHRNSIVEKEAPPEEMDVISSCTANNNVVDINVVMEVDNTNNVVDTMLQCVHKLNNGVMEHGLIEAASDKKTIAF